MNFDDWFVHAERWPWLFLVPAALFATGFLDRRRRRRLTTLAGPRCEPLTRELSPERRRTRRRLGSAALLATLVAVLEPAWGEGGTGTGARGVDIVVALDVSRSMLAADMVPDRLSAARREIRALAARAEGDRLALVVFAGEARVLVPPTVDTKTLLTLLEQASPSSVLRGGTDLGAALEASLSVVADLPGGGPAAIILVTDGEDLEGRGAAMAATCRERGVVVHAVGFGSPRGSKIAIRGEEGTSFLKDRSGGEVISTLDAAALATIAEAGGGVSLNAGTSPAPLVGLYDDEIATRARKSFEAELRAGRTPRFQIPLVLAVGFLMAGFAVSERRRP